MSHISEVFKKKTPERINKYCIGVSFRTVHSCPDSLSDSLPSQELACAAPLAASSQFKQKPMRPRPRCFRSFERTCFVVILCHVAHQGNLMKSLDQISTRLHMTDVHIFCATIFEFQQTLARVKQ